MGVRLSMVLSDLKALASRLISTLRFVTAISQTQRQVLGCLRYWDAHCSTLDDPNFVPGKLEVHHGTITLGKNAYMDFNLDGKVIGTLEAVSTGLIEGTISPIGGTTVLGWTQGSWTAQNVPNYSQEAIEKAMYNFLPGGPQAPFPTSNITVHETIQTAWSSSDGALSPGTSIITGVTAFPDPTHLALTWKPDVSSYSTVTWEIENRLEENLAQSQDFLAGIWAAVAVTAGLMALAVIGNVIRTIIYGRMKD